jgi:cholestenol delta-isomerase
MEAMLNTTKLAVPHPYYPAEAEIVGYLANEFSTPVLLAFFVGGCAAISALTLSIVNRGHRHLSNREKVTILWFVLSKPPYFYTATPYARVHRLTLTNCLERRVYPLLL